MRMNQILRIIRLYHNKKLSATSFTCMRMTLKKSVLKSTRNLSSILKKPKFTLSTTKQQMKGISFSTEASLLPVMKKSTTLKFKSPNNHKMSFIHPCILFMKKTINFNPINKSNTQSKRIWSFSIIVTALLKTNFISIGHKNGQLGTKLGIKYWDLNINQKMLTLL